MDVDGLPFHSEGAGERVAKLLLTGRVFTNRALANEANVSRMTVFRVIKALEEKTGLEVQRLTGADGKTINYQVVLPSENGGRISRDSEDTRDNTDNVFILVPLMAAPVHIISVGITNEGAVASFISKDYGMFVGRLDEEATIPARLWGSRGELLKMCWRTGKRTDVEIGVGSDVMKLTDVERVG